MKIIAIAAVIGLASGIASAQTGGELKAHPDTTGWAEVFAAELSNAECPPGVWS